MSELSMDERSTKVIKALLEILNVATFPNLDRQGCLQITAICQTAEVLITDLETPVVPDEDILDE